MAVQVLRRSVRRLQEWPVWELPAPLQTFILAVDAAAVAAMAVAAAKAPWHVRDAVVYGGLLACGMAAIEVTRSISEIQGGVVRNLLPVWYTAIAITLPPVYAFIAPFPLIAYRLWRAPKRPFVWRRIFSNAVISLAYGCASLVFHAVPRGIAGADPGTGQHALTWAAVAAGCGVLGWVLNLAPLLIAMKLNDRHTRARSWITSPEDLLHDLIDLTLGIALALVVAISPSFMVLFLPAVIAIRRHLLKMQMFAQARTDTVTSLLNAAAWRYEAELDYFRRSQPLALLLVDIDHFRSISETAGSDAGNQVLRSIATATSALLGSNALIGRLASDMFGILIPQLPGDARRTGERIRDRVAAEPVEIEDGARAGFVFRPTVSVGVAVTDGPSSLDDLITAARTALADAKAGGRNTVRVKPAVPANLSPNTVSKA
jgi:diguanylate cyclase (GGDEF)-like protein